MRSHRHADLMLQYAQDAIQNPEPWLLWQFLEPGTTQWEDLCNSCMWTPEYQYRRKAKKVILINGIEIPEPIRVRPRPGSYYYLTETASDDYHLGCIWNNDVADRRWFSRGLCHHTAEAAIAHAKAILGLTATIRL